MSTTYRVTGRYMNGSEIQSYHLLGNDNSSLVVSRDKAILLISRGLIENMRVQYSGDNVIIRGKGINLNTLPVFDINKDKFRESNAPKTGNTKKNKMKNPMAQYRVTKRVMYKTSCVGYVIQDASGKEVRINRQKTIELAVKGLIINADAQKYTPAGSVESRLILRGTDGDLKKLPVILVDMNGNVVDTSKKNQNITVRATQSRKSGIIYCESNNSTKTFSSGDYIVVTPNGGLNIVAMSAARDKMQRSMDTYAICDTYLENLVNYSIEFFGQQKRKISPDIVTKWPIVTISR